jgi:hypothetical protein
MHRRQPRPLGEEIEHLDAVASQAIAELRGGLLDTNGASPQ